MKLTMLLHVLLSCGFLLGLAGCGDPDRPIPTTGLDVMSLGKPVADIEVIYGGVDDRIVFMLLSQGLPSPERGGNRDHSNKRGTSFTRDGVSWDFKWTYPDGKKFDWQCEASSSGEGTLTIDGKKHDLTKGFIFLAARKDGGVIVKQLQRETIATKDGGANIKHLEKDAEITRFFAQE